MTVDDTWKRLSDYVAAADKRGRASFVVGGVLLMAAAAGIVGFAAWVEFVERNNGYIGPALIAALGMLLFNVGTVMVRSARRSTQ
jgi:hypothetical protein